MVWKGRRESENVEDRRGMGGGGLAIGGIGGLILVLAITLLGGDPGQVIGQLQGQSAGKEYKPTAKEEAIPNETKAIKAFKEKAIDELVVNLKNVLEGGEEAALRLNVNTKTEEIALELELKGAKGKLGISQEAFSVPDDVLKAWRDAADAIA